MMKKKITALFTSLLLLLGGCGDTTETPVVKEIDRIAIDTPSPDFLYATTDELNVTARVYYNDGTSADITANSTWKTDYTLTTILYGTITPVANGDGNGNEATFEISVQYQDLNDSYSPLRLIPITALSIDDSNITNDPNAIDTTKVYTLYADGNYSDGTTLRIQSGNSKNVTWSVEGNVTIIDVSDGVLQVQFSDGDSNITVSAFDINDTKSYTAP